MSPSSSTRRAASASGSKVITDPREAGSDLLELRFERLGVLVGHRYAPWHFLNFLPLPHQHGSLRPVFSCGDACTVCTTPAATGSPPAAAIACAPVLVSCSYCRLPFVVWLCVSCCASSGASSA